MASKKAKAASVVPTAVVPPIVPTAVLYTVADQPELFAGVSRFIGDHAAVESSGLIKAAVDDAGKCLSVAALFRVPLEHRAFSMENAIGWAFFLSVAAARASAESRELWAGWDVADAFATIAQVYDQGVQEYVWECFEVDESSNEDDDEGDDEGDEEDEEKDATA